MSSPTASIPKGSLVLVTGATGYIASHIILQFLERGYKVRGTVRDVKRASWLNDELFPTYAKSGAFELAEVPDLASPGAFDEAVKGASGVVHVASIVTMSPNPNEVIPQTVKGALSALESAAKEQSVKAFVYTSSIVSAKPIMPNVEVTITQDSWTDLKDYVWSPGPYEPERSFPVYIQSKAEAERAVWKFVEDNKPSFSVNTVLPGMVIGEVLNSRQWGLTAGWIKSLWEGDVDSIKNYAAFSYIDVKDVALAHVAGILDPDTNGQRIPIWSHTFNWNDALAIFRKLYPDRKFVNDLDGLGKSLVKIDDSKTLELLKKWGNQDGYGSLENVLKIMGAQLSELNTK